LIGDIDEPGAKAKAAELSDGLAMKMDVSKDTDWKSAVDLCVNKWGRIDICVNNAGTTYKNKVRIRLFTYSSGLVSYLLTSTSYI
jgi:NADP-dependent 3-hydroxy acid dehydrogenase YdfG